MFQVISVAAKRSFCTKLMIIYNIPVIPSESRKFNPIYRWWYPSKMFHFTGHWFMIRLWLRCTLRDRSILSPFPSLCSLSLFLFLAHFLSSSSARLLFCLFATQFKIPILIGTMCTRALAIVRQACLFLCRVFDFMYLNWDRIAHAQTHASQNHFKHFPTSSESMKLPPSWK